MTLLVLFGFQPYYIKLLVKSRTSFVCTQSYKEVKYVKRVFLSSWGLISERELVELVHRLSSSVDSIPHKTFRRIQWHSSLISFILYVPSSYSATGVVQPLRQTKPWPIRSKQSCDLGCQNHYRSRPHVSIPLVSVPPLFTCTFMAF